MLALVVITTILRFSNIIFVVTRDAVNLPALVLVLTSAMVLYGITLSAKRFFTTIRLKQFMVFFLIHSLIISFNIVYVAVTSPLQVTVSEALIVGTFFDLIVFGGVLFACIKQLRSNVLTPASSLN